MQSFGGKDGMGSDPKGEEESPSWIERN